MSEINVFTIDPNGFKVHWKISESSTEDDLDAVITREGELSKFLHENNFKPDFMGAPRPAEPAAQEDKPRPWQSNSQQSAPQQQGVVCQFCKGAVYDNRGSKPTAKSPDYKCKNKQQCGAAAWEQEDGTLRWVKGNS